MAAQFLIGMATTDHPLSFAVSFGSAKWKRGKKGGRTISTSDAPVFFWIFNDIYFLEQRTFYSSWYQIDTRILSNCSLQRRLYLLRRRDREKRFSLDFSCAVVKSAHRPLKLMTDRKCLHFSPLPYAISKISFYSLNSFPSLKDYTSVLPFF